MNSRLSWKKKVHYYAYKSMTLNLNLILMNAVRINCFFKIHFNVILPATPVSPDVFRFSDLNFICLMRSESMANLIILDLIILIFGKE
jgi:hypothetical protein